MANAGSLVTVKTILSEFEVAKVGSPLHLRYRHSCGTYQPVPGYGLPTHTKVGGKC